MLQVLAVFHSASSLPGSFPFFLSLLVFKLCVFHAGNMQMNIVVMIPLRYQTSLPPMPCPSLKCWNISACFQSPESTRKSSGADKQQHMCLLWLYLRERLITDSPPSLQGREGETPTGELWAHCQLRAQAPAHLSPQERASLSPPMESILLIDFF